MSRLNIKIEFPIILFIDNQYSVHQDERRYTIIKRSKIPRIEKMEEYVIDAKGVKYKRTRIIPQENINILGGFHILYGFGTCYVKKELEKIEILPPEKLRSLGNHIIQKNQSYFSGTLLPITKWKQEFDSLTDRDELLRYLFYFADTSRYYDPDHHDQEWRTRKGFIENK